MKNVYNLAIKNVYLVSSILKCLSSNWINFLLYYSNHVQNEFYVANTNLKSQIFYPYKPQKI